MTHLKSLASPKSWPIKRKERKWVTRAMPGTHSSKIAIPLIVLLRDILKVVENKKEAKYAINEGLIKVNNRNLKDVKLPVGLFDVVSIEKTNKYYRISLNKKHKIIPIEIDKKEANILPLKIKNKKILKNGIIQLNFTNGWNINTKDKNYSPKDTVVFDLSSNKIVDHIPLNSGNIVFLSGGKHTGIFATIDTIENGVILKEDKKTWKGTSKYIFVIGKKAPIIKLIEK